MIGCSAGRIKAIRFDTKSTMEDLGGSHVMDVLAIL